MNQLIIVLPLLTLMMFLIGLELNIDDLKASLKSPRALIIGLIGQLLLLPAIAFIIASLLEMPAPFFVGFVLIACCPGGSSSNILTYIAKGDVALSVMLTTVSSLLTLITLPLFMSYLFVSIYKDTEHAIHFPIPMLIAQNIIMILFPILLGIVIRYYKRNWAQKCAQYIQKIITPALLLMVLLFCIEHHTIIATYYKQLGISTILLLLSSALIGLIIAVLNHLKVTQRKAITIEIGIQNAAQAIALACSPVVFNNFKIAIPAIIYAIIMNIIILTYVFIPQLIRKKATI